VRLHPARALVLHDGRLVQDGPFDEIVAGVAG